MITFSKSYTVNDQTFATLELAQEFELQTLLAMEAGTEPLTFAHAAKLLVAHQEQVIDALTTRASSRPKARKANGGKKVRKTKVLDEKLETTEDKTTDTLL